MIAPARIAALRVLQAVHADRADLPGALAQARTHLSDERDRALLVELATGTLRWLGAIDHLIAHGAKRPLARLDPEVRDVLRLGIYQLLHLDRVPASAVVDDAVELTRRAGKSSAAGLVNAVLRGVSRTRTALPLPAKPSVGADGKKLRGNERAIAKKRALCLRALNDLDRWASGAPAIAAE